MQSVKLQRSTFFFKFLSHTHSKSMHTTAAVNFFFSHFKLKNLVSIRTDLRLCISNHKKDFTTRCFNVNQCFVLVVVKIYSDEWYEDHMGQKCGIAPPHMYIFLYCQRISIDLHGNYCFLNF